VTSKADSFSFKAALADLPRGEPVTAALLRKHGATTSHASWMARHDWLHRLGNDAYLLPGDTLTREGALAYLSARIPGFHVGSRTALAWRGVRHNLEAKDSLSLWGDRTARLPAWFVERFGAHYQVTRLFDTEMPTNLGLQPLPAGRPDVLVSVPERALLELLSDVGKQVTLETARQLTESLRNLRAPVLDQLLSHATRIKVVRLAAMLAGEAHLAWAPVAQKHSRRLGGGQRWVGVTKSGERIDLKRP